MLTPAQPHSLRHKAALAKATRADQHQVVRTIHKLSDIGNLFHPVREVLGLDNRSKFERVLHTVNSYYDFFRYDFFRNHLQR